MVEIKKYPKNVDSMVIAKDVIGKNVIDERGTKVGTVKKLHLNPYTFYVEGITLDNGLFRDKDFVGSEYIGSLTESGAVLLMIPITQYMGMLVYDSNGEKIGKVKDITRIKDSNNLLNITVDRGVNDGDMIINEKFIESVGENIVLNAPVDAA